MRGKLARIAARAVTAGAVVALGAGSATAAVAAPAYVTFTVPCSASALNDAITGASSGDTLVLKAGCIYQLDSALPDITRNLVINGHGATVERSYNGSPAQFSVFTVTTNAGLVLENVNVRNGDSTTNGGGVDVQHGGLLVFGGVFTDNRATDSGGAIYVSGNTTPSFSPAFKSAFKSALKGAVTPDFPVLDLGVLNTVFTENHAQYGGAIYTDVNDPAEVLGSHFNDNHAQYGGAYGINDNSLAADNNFTGNGAQKGGGVYVDSSGTPTLTGNDFVQNHAESGGGLYNDNTVTVNGGRFTSNRASDGGGIYNDNADTATIDGTAFKANTAGDGGAMENDGTATVTHTTAVQNTARYYGGAFYNYSSGTMTIGTSTIVLNSAGDGGGGIYNDASSGAVTVTSSHVADNRPDNCEPSGFVTGCTG